MSMNLAELGRIIRRDLEEREMGLNTIRSEISKKLRNDRNELMGLRDNESLNQQAARKQIWEDTNNLLDLYRNENQALVYGLRTERVKHINEIKTWVTIQGEDLKGWHDAISRYYRKRTGR